MKRALILLLIALIFIGCCSKHTINISRILDVIPPESTNIKLTDKDDWFTFDRGGKHYLLYYRFFASIDEYMIIEDSVKTKEDESKINADVSRYDDVYKYDSSRNVYFNKSSFKTEIIQNSDDPSVFTIRTYIKYRLSLSSDDVEHLETFDTHSTDKLYELSKKNVISILKSNMW